MWAEIATIEGAKRRARIGAGRRRFATIAQPAERAFLCHAQYQAAEEARPNRHS
jgi:hypothetical protein